MEEIVVAHLINHVEKDKVTVMSMMIVTLVLCADTTIVWALVLIVLMTVVVSSSKYITMKKDFLMLTLIHMAYFPT